MESITRKQAIEKLTEETLQYYLGHPEILRESIQFGNIGFEALSNEELVLEYTQAFEEEVEIG